MRSNIWWLIWVILLAGCASLLEDPLTHGAILDLEGVLSPHPIGHRSSPHDPRLEFDVVASVAPSDRFLVRKEFVTTKCGVLSGDDMFLAIGTDRSGGGIAAKVLCFRENEVAWEFDVDSAILEPESNRPAFAEPLGGNDSAIQMQLQAGGGRGFVLAVTSTASFVAAIDLETGEVLWRAVLGKGCEIAYMGIGGSEFLVAVVSCWGGGSDLFLFDPGSGGVTKRLRVEYGCKVTRGPDRLWLEPLKDGVDHKKRVSVFRGSLDRLELIDL